MMEGPPGQEPVGAAESEAAAGGVELSASDEALSLLSDIEPVELLRCVFLDSLVTMSRCGRQVGTFTVNVEFSNRLQQSCVLLHAQSQGTIEDSPCGTTVTAFLTTNLEVLEEDYYEYVNLKGHTVEKRCHMVQEGGQMVITKVTTAGEETTTESISYATTLLKGLITEGSTLLLMRVLAMRRNVPKHMTFIALDQDSNLFHTTFSKLDAKTMDIGGQAVEVFGLERTVHTKVDTPAVWHCYFLDDGHLASREHIGSPVSMSLLQLPSGPKKGFEKFPLDWERDMQLNSMFLDRKIEMKADHNSYLHQHPEIRALISDFLQFLVLRKPDDVFQFARDYFLLFATQKPPDSNPETSSV